MYSTASVACKNWHPDTTSGTYLPPNTREASYAISPILLSSFGEEAFQKFALNLPCSNSFGYYFKDNVGGASL